MILDANRVLKTESFDRSTGTSTPTSSKKKSVVIIAPRTSSFSVSSRTSSQHQMSSASASPVIMTEVKGVALVPPTVESPISFKTEGYADVAWQNLNEKLDMLLKSDNYGTLSSSGSSEIPRSPKRHAEETPLQHHGSNNSLLSGGERHSGEGRPENGASRSLLNHASTSTTSPVPRAVNGHTNGHQTNDLSRVLEQESFSNTSSPNASHSKSVLKKKSSRSLVKRLSSHNVMVDNTLYIDDDSNDEEEEVYGVAMNTSKQQQDIDLDRMLQVHEKQTQLKTRSISVCSSDEEDMKPVKVRDLRRAASYVYDQREGASGAGNHHSTSSSSLSVIVEVSPPPSNSTMGTVEQSPRQESLSDKQRRELEEQQLKELVFQQQLQIQQLQLQQQRLLEQHQLQQQGMSQPSPVESKVSPDFFLELRV